MGSKKKSTVGYRYNTGVHMALGLGPWDSISQVKYGDKIAWEGVAAGGQIVINQPNLYGGDEGEGGISGAVDVMMGLPNQARNPYLLARQGALASACRDLVSLVFRDAYWGNAPYYKSISVRGTRVMLGDDGQPQWYAAKAAILREGQPGPDMNPAHIIREALTRIKREPASRIDEVNFRAAADTLHAEGFGLSLFWEGETPADDFIQAVQNTVDGKMYIHPRTGLYTLKLIRRDYDAGGLPTLGPQQIKRVDDYMRPEPDELPNSIAVTYWSMAEGSKATIQTGDPAAIMSAGRQISINRDYSDSVTSAELAAEVGQRDLVAAGAPTLSATLTCTPAAAGLLPGDAFLFDWPKLHDSPVVMRVASIKRGGLLNRRVVIEAIESVFELTDATTAIVQPEWEDPRNAELPQAVALAVEAPYYELLQRFGVTQVTEFLATTPDAGMILATAARADNAINAIAYADGVEWAARADLSPTGTLNAAALPAASLLDITWSALPATGSHIQIGGELMRFDGLAGALSQVGRGVLDTVPAAHAAGARAWAWDAFAVTDEVEHAGGESVSVTLALRNNSRVGALSPATVVTMDERAIRPYPPGRLRIGGAAYPVTITGQLALAWAHRDRITQADGPLVDSDATSVGPETGTTYTLRIYGEGGALLRTVANIAGTGYTYAEADEITDSALPGGRTNGKLRIELESVRDGYASAQHHDYTVARSGYGFNHGERYGA